MAIGQLPMYKPGLVARAECRTWKKPCRLTACRYHLGVRARKQPCALNVAERGPMSTERIALRMGMSAENVRLIEIAAEQQIKPELRALGIIPDNDTGRTP